MASQTEIAVQLLERTEYFLMEFGWIKGENQNKKGMCMIAALDRATVEKFGGEIEEHCDNPVVHLAWNAIRKAIEESTGDQELWCIENLIVGFNDHEQINFNHVKAVLVKARVNLRVERVRFQHA